MSDPWQRYIGTATSRVDGRAKVTGAAKYAAEFNVPASPMAASSPRPSPRAGSCASTRARRCGVDGVLDVLTHENRPQHGRIPTRPTRTMSRRTARRSGRSTTTRSCSAASRSRWWSPKTGRSRASRRRSCASSTSREPHVTDLYAQRDEAFVGRDKPREAARRRRRRPLRRPTVRHEAEYFIPIEHHNPMELFASTVVWDGDGKLTVYDKTQGVQNVQRYLCSVFGMKPDDVRVMSPFVGGAFGSGLAPAVPGGAGGAGGARR